MPVDDVDADQVRVAVDGEFESGVEWLGLSGPCDAPLVDDPAGGALIEGECGDVPAVGVGVEYLAGVGAGDAGRGGEPVREQHGVGEVAEHGRRVRVDGCAGA
ncbi:hypothetical protein [Microbacterium sp. C7(2022)]|uniref:hypothetical protein n=1 Tax=Microbacterium sp. C7(2022) TaxID=2992759 RepID=UPI00237B32FA|nr:hypothetical protein [Microbacterium sp. C7(2022)]MDE0545512.1 hypothetical protein [Microbacterium sp. C7(2022)]